MLKNSLAHNTEIQNVMTERITSFRGVWVGVCCGCLIKETEKKERSRAPKNADSMHS